MNYRELNNKDNLSALGFGCMRFPKKGNGFDHEEIERELRYAIENGVNYFDTAYLYPGNEEAFGRALEKIGARDRIFIATKMPHYFKMFDNMDHASAITAELVPLDMAATDTPPKSLP